FALTPFADASGLDRSISAALTADRAATDQLVAQLREQGPNGLAALTQHFATDLAAIRQSPRTSSPDQQRLRALIDATAAQKDAAFSELFWFTDVERAKAAAAAAGKPILSLRLLGRLDEERSCANSRFFRTVLYANESVSGYLRDHFILHWESVRPVPKITIDFGDGRTMERTITGNSIHYVLDSTGRPIDALPGLYSPAGFLSLLKRTEAVVGTLAAFNESSFQRNLREYHAKTLLSADEERRSAFAKAGVAEAATRRMVVTPAAGAFSAAEAGVLAKSKRVVEMPLVAATNRLRQLSSITDTDWTKVAAAYPPTAALDANSRVLFASKQPADKTSEAVQAALTAFERTLAEDTARNEFVLHARLHEWFATGTAPAALAELNEKVYTELFLTPSSDPWLGLAPADAYSALEGDGLVRR
ncbi:MAG TPA: hypothetical protein VF614_06240, partial [Chthoniobacteraceae bacterium]